MPSMCLLTEAGTCSITDQVAGESITQEAIDMEHVNKALALAAHAREIQAQVCNTLTTADCPYV